MKTVAWYRIESRATAHELTAMMRAEELSREASQGYIVNSTNERQINGVFVSTKRSSKSFNDIFGNEISTISVDYVEIEFELNFEYSYMEVVSGRSGVRSLLSSLSSIANFRIGFSNIAVDVLRWSELLLARMDSGMSVDRVLINGLQYPQAHGRLEISCDWNVSDVARNVSSLSDAAPHIERMRLRSLRPHHELRSILLDRSGFCRISAAPERMAAVISSSRQALLGARA